MCWSKRLVGYDTETTGTTEEARIVEMGVVVWEDGLRVVGFSWLLNPGDIDWRDPNVARAMEINRIKPEQLRDKPTFAEAFSEIRHALEQAEVRCGHNARFDQRMLRQEFARAVQSGKLRKEDAQTPGQKFVTLDTLALDLHIHPEIYTPHARNLANTAARWGLGGWDAHRAEGDAEAAVRILQNMVSELPDNLQEVLKLQAAAHVKWDEICAKKARKVQAGA